MSILVVTMLEPSQPDHQPVLPVPALGSSLTAADRIRSVAESSGNVQARITALEEFWGQSRVPLAAGDAAEFLHRLSQLYKEAAGENFQSHQGQGRAPRAAEQAARSIIRNINKLEPEALGNCSTAFISFGLVDDIPAIAARAKVAISERPGTFDARSLTNIRWACVKARRTDRATAATLDEEALRIPWKGPDAARCAVRYQWAAAVSRSARPELIKIFSPVVAANVKALGLKDLADYTWSRLELARNIKGISSDEGKAALQAVAQDLPPRIAELKPGSKLPLVIHDLASIAQHLLRLKASTATAHAAITSFVSKHMDAATCPDIAALAFSTASGNFPAAQFMDAVVQNVPLRLTTLSPGSISLLFGAFELASRREEGCLESLAGEAARRKDEFTDPTAICHLLRAMRRLNIRHEGFLDAFAEKIEKNLRQYTFEQRCRVALCYACLERYHPSLFSAIVSGANRDLTFNFDVRMIPALADLSYAIALVKCREGLSVVDFARVSIEEHLDSWTRYTTALARMQYTFMRLGIEVTQAFLGLRCAPGPARVTSAASPYEGFAANVAEVFKRLGLEFDQHRKVGEFEIDFIVYVGGRKIAFNCDGVAFHTRGGKGEAPRLADVVRQDWLRAEGYEVTGVTDIEWKAALEAGTESQLVLERLGLGAKQAND